MSSKVEKIVKLYKTLSKTHILVGGRIANNGITVETQWTQRDIEKGKYIKYSKTHVITSKLEKLSDSKPFDTTNELLSAVGPSEKYRAVIREITCFKEEKKQFLEIWSNNYLTNIVDLTTLDIHGSVYTDADFGSLEWSPCETKVLYIAEKKIPKREPFYKRKSDKTVPSSDGDSATPPTKGEEYTYQQEWGENMVGKVQSVIALYDVNEDTVKILEGIPENMCPGQVLWSPDGTRIAGITWDTSPRKLGIVYCTNRASKIFTLDLAGEYHEISDDDRAVQCPRFTPDGKYLLWMEGAVGGPHRSAMALMKMEFCNANNPAKKSISLIDIIDTETTTSNNKPFYGLYNMKFPRRCWANDNRRVIFSTTQKTDVKTYVLDVENCVLTELEYDYSLVVYDVINDLILASKKCYLHPDTILIGKLPEKGSERHIVWQCIQDAPIISGLTKYTFHYMDISHNNNDAVTDFNAIYLGPKDGDIQSVPLIVWPHGGPHSSYFNAFSLESTLFATLGFAMLFVNYRGSLGCGQRSVEFLCGRVGDADVKDCVLAAQECCKKFPWINPNKMVLNGGSHGGFLVHHLSGQYPDMFKAVLSRNPVVDIATMSLVSDIPDWCYVEAGYEFSQKGHVDDEMFFAMRKASPIQVAHKIKAPTFLMLGAKDLRVPASQGIELFHRLRANNVPVKMNLYDDNHPLGQISNEMDNLINGALWLLEHTE